MLESFHNKDMEKSSPKSPLNYSVSFRTNNFSIYFGERPRTQHSHKFRISGRVQDSRNQYVLLLETTNLFNEYTKNPQSLLGDIISGNLTMLGIENSETLEKPWPSKPECPPNYFLKHFHMGSRYPRKHDVECW